MAALPTLRSAKDQTASNARSVIPVDAVADWQLGCSTATRWRLFKKLSLQGYAWQHPDGTKYFDSRHPIIRKHLIKGAGIPDDDWGQASGHQQKAATDKCRFIERVELEAERMIRSGRSRAEAFSRVCTSISSEVLARVVSVTTYYAWRRKYLASGRLRSSMLDNRGRKSGDTKSSPEAWEYFKGLYLTTHRRSIRFCFDRTAAKAHKTGWSWPTYRTIVRGVHKQLPPQKADFWRLGERRWRAKHAPKLVRDKSDLPANHTWEIDHFKYDFWARAGKRRIRPWCTIIIDRGSNLPVGWAITTNPSSDSLSLALRRVVKAYGASRQAVLDNGQDMRAGSFGNRRGWLDPQWAGGVFDQLGVELHWCQSYSPWAKGQVEAFARTAHAQFDVQFDSYCGGSPEAKPEGIDKWCAEHFNQLPTAEEVEALFAEFVKTFAERPSDAQGIKPLSPRQRFEQTRIAKRTVPDDVLNILLLKLTGPRQVTTKGVLYNGLHYTDDGGRLFEHQSKQVRLRVDPDDISQCWICDMAGKPLFIARQNYVQGTADDVRRGRNRTQRAKRLCRDARSEQVAALDDTVTATLRAQADYYRSQTRHNEPADGPPPAEVSAILTPAAMAVAEEQAHITREQTHDRGTRGLRGTERPAVADLTAEEMAALSLPDDDQLDLNDLDDFTMEAYVQEISEDPPARIKRA